MGFLASVKKWCRRIFWSITTTIILLAVLLTLGVSYYIDYSVFHPAGFNATESYNYMYSEYPFLRHWVDSLRRNNALCDTLILSPDSVTLHAFYMKAPKPTRNTAVVVHGFHDNAIRMFHIAYLYNHDLRFNVLVPDLRTHGESGGDHVGMGWDDYKDVERWMSIANDRFGGDTRMVVHGISMGGATVMMLSGNQQPDYVKCLVEDCGYTSVEEEVEYVVEHDYHIPSFPFVNIASRYNEWQRGWSYAQASSLAQLQKCTIPMLFIHGTEDTYVPTSMVYKLYEAKPRNKAIWEVQGVMHARSYHDRRNEYTKQVSAFVKSYFYKD